jgi:LytS/YehU family sensor histidine kinase
MTRTSAMSNLRIPIVLLDTLIFLGPCIVLAVQMSGRGFSESLNAGAHHGYSLLWVVVLALVFKYALIDGIARYTLAKGEHIFDGFHGFPGPKHWEVYFIALIYCLEMMGYGVIALFSGFFLQQVVPGGISQTLLAGVTVGIVFSLILIRSYTIFERVVIFTAGVMVAGVIYCLSAIIIPLEKVPEGLVPVMTGTQIIDITLILSAVGSGLGLLCYSIWMRDKIGDNHGPAYFSDSIRKVRFSQGTAFVLTGALTFAFITMGMSSSGGEEIASGVAAAMTAAPSGALVFFLLGYVSLFGILLTGTQGRTRAISAILSGNRLVPVREELLYRLLGGVLCTIMLLVIIFGSPGLVISLVSATATLFFSIVGFMVLYLDYHLPGYARGSGAWFVVMIVGSLGFLLVALLREGMLLSFAVPLVGLLALLFLVVYLLSQTCILNSAKRGTLTFQEIGWVIGIFSLYAIVGINSTRGVGEPLMLSAIIAPMVAGVLAGPFAGVTTGLIAGGAGMFSGGYDAGALALGSLLSGCIGGLSYLFLKNKWSYGKMILVGSLTGIVALLPLLLPVFNLVHLSDPADVFNFIGPSVFAAIAALILLFYILQEEVSPRRVLPTPGSAIITRVAMLRPGCIPLVAWYILCATILGIAVGTVFFIPPLLSLVWEMSQRIAVIGLVLYFLTKSRSFLSILIGRLSYTEAGWLIMVFSLISIYGGMQGIWVNDIAVRLSDLGPILAGLLGGPIIGLVTGLVGGVYFLAAGGWDAAPWIIETTVIGLVSGILSMYWRGRFTYPKMIGLGVCAAFIHFLLLAAAYAASPMSADISLELITTVIVPEAFAYAATLVLFLFILRNQTVSLQSLPFSDDTQGRDHSIARAAISADQMMAAIAEIFSIISGRLLSLSYLMAELDEPAIAARLKRMVHIEEVEEVLDEFRKFSDLSVGGEVSRMQVIIKAGQVVTGLQKILSQERLSSVVNTFHIRRADRLISDYLTLLRGEEPVPDEAEVDLNSLVGGLIDGLKQVPVTDEELLNRIEDTEAYIEALLSRLAYVPVFLETALQFVPGASVRSVCTDRERLSELLVTLFEECAATGSRTIMVGTSVGDGGTDITIAPESLPAKFIGDGVDSPVYSLQAKYCRGSLSLHHQDEHAVIVLHLESWPPSAQS